MIRTGIRTAALATILAAGAATADELPTLADLDRNAGLKAAFADMTKGADLPEWIGQGLVTSPTESARFDGHSWLVMSGCKPHDCAAHAVAVIYSPDSGAMHGVVSEADTDGQSQVLHWLNIGGGAESIDGRTILFAALTGSLANHPGAFDFDQD